MYAIRSYYDLSRLSSEKYSILYAVWSGSGAFRNPYLGALHCSLGTLFFCRAFPLSAFAATWAETAILDLCYRNVHP